MGTMASFSVIGGITLSTKDGLLYVSDSFNNLIRSVDLDSTSVATIAGKGGGNNNAVFPIDGIGTHAVFNYPFGICYGEGTLFIGDMNNYVIRSIFVSSNYSMSDNAAVTKLSKSPSMAPTKSFVSHSPSAVTTSPPSILPISSNANANANSLGPTSGATSSYSSATPSVPSLIPSSNNASPSKATSGSIANTTAIQATTLSTTTVVIIVVVSFIVAAFFLMLACLRSTRPSKIITSSAYKPLDSRRTTHIMPP